MTNLVVIVRQLPLLPLHLDVFNCFISPGRKGPVSMPFLPLSLQSCIALAFLALRGGIHAQGSDALSESIVVPLAMGKLPFRFSILLDIHCQRNKQKYIKQAHVLLMSHVLLYSCSRPSISQRKPASTFWSRIPLRPVLVFEDEPC